MLLPLLLIGLLTLIQQDVPEFEVASVRAADPNIHAIGVLQAQDALSLPPGGEFALKNRSVAELIQFAYAVHPTQVTGLPDWAFGKRYDVVAKAPQGAAPGSSRLMMKTLLASDFKLTAHIEDRPMLAFALMLAKKKPMLKESSGTELVGCHWGVAKLEQDGQTRLECLRMNMADFVYLLPRFAPGYVDKPIRDMTGLTGSYDFVLESTKKALVDAGSGGLTMYDALEKQVGLKLQEKKIPMPVVVVEHVEQPSGN
jgi:uncharacterized protein (TIGR03435 family)